MAGQRCEVASYHRSMSDAYGGDSSSGWLADPPEGVAASEEARALTSLLARSMGLDRFPLPGGTVSSPVMPAEEAAGVVADAAFISGPARLQVLGVLARSEARRAVLEPIAASLIRPDLDVATRDEAVNELLSKVAVSRLGQDPLGRSGGAQTTTQRAFYALLADDVRSTWLSFIPRCREAIADVGGTPAISLTTTGESHLPLAAFRPTVDPRDWPSCPLKRIFFNSMDMVAPSRPPPVPLSAPDSTGWSARLMEVVDFSFGTDPTGSSTMRTDLDFVFFDSPTALGCTYDLGTSLDGKVSVDRGYLLVEDLQSTGLRRVTTLKQVYFTSGIEPPGDACSYWSLALGLVAWACVP